MKPSNVQQAQKKPVRWWEIALLTIAVTVLSGLTTGKPQKQNRHFYEEEMKQPAWAPPGWVFGPAWTVNNIFTVRALLYLLKNGHELPGRKRLLILQAMIWSVFCSFGYLYFKKRSNILGGIWTLADAVFASMSFVIARRMDKKLANNYIPLMAWTAFASTIAIPQALQNDDHFLHTKALLN